MLEHLNLPQSHLVITGNWLTQKPNPNALIVILISTLIVILGSFFHWNNILNLTEGMPANPTQVFTQHEYWRAWTSLLVHGDFKHLASNLFLFTVLGYFMAGYFSLLFFPLAAFLVGGITNLIVLSNMPPHTFLIGLSGLVYWLGGAWLILYFMIENRRTTWQKALRAIGVALLIFMPSEAFDPSISYEAHSVGFILGVLSGAIFYLINRTLFRSADTHTIIDEVPEDFFPETNSFYSH